MNHSGVGLLAKIEPNIVIPQKPPISYRVPGVTNKDQLDTESIFKGLHITVDFSRPYHKKLV